MYLSPKILELDRPAPAKAVVSRISFFPIETLARAKVSFWVGENPAAADLIFQVLLGIAWRELWLCGVKMLPSQRMKTEVYFTFLVRLNFKTSWLLSLNLNIRAKMATCFVRFQLCGVSVLQWFRGKLRLAWGAGQWNPTLTAACQAIISGTRMSLWSQWFVSWRIWLTNVKPNFRGAGFLC